MESTFKAASSSSVTVSEYDWLKHIGVFDDLGFLESFTIRDFEKIKKANQLILWQRSVEPWTFECS